MLNFASASLEPHMLRSLAVVLALLLAVEARPASQSGRAARPDAQAFAQAVQMRYQNIRDFSADFVHAYRGGVLRTETTERGTVTIKKPGRMRWVYTSPERKEFVSDGQKVYAYVPADRQVVVSSVDPADQGSTPALFLTGKGDIARDFTASFVESPVTGALGLKLVPRRQEPDYQHFVLAIEPSTLQLRALSTVDRQGGESTLTFAKMKENQGISDKEFAFRIPRGVDVINDGTVN